MNNFGNRLHQKNTDKEEQEILSNKIAKVNEKKVTPFIK